MGTDGITNGFLTSDCNRTGKDGKKIGIGKGKRSGAFGTISLGHNNRGKKSGNKGNSNINRDSLRCNHHRGGLKFISRKDSLRLISNRDEHGASSNRANLRCNSRGNLRCNSGRDSRHNHHRGDLTLISRKDSLRFNSRRANLKCNNKGNLSLNSDRDPEFNNRRYSLRVSNRRNPKAGSKVNLRAINKGSCFTRIGFGNGCSGVFRQCTGGCKWQL